MRVVDAAALVEYLVDPASDGPVVEWLTDAGRPLAVPHVCDLEVASAVRSMLLRGESGLDEAIHRLALYRELPLERFDHLPLLDRVWALRDNFNAYAAAYVALAEALDAPFLTADARLADAVNRFTDVEALVA